ncbi:hypothetical protein [Zavarzinia sp.]|uniref:hypothetical protein n=1 Tax=Zavarzinia sp. TaxID=2027920 RepID=UPI003568C937
MAMTNAELIAKAQITTEALAVAGRLNPEQADKFLDYVVDQSVLKNLGRVIRVKDRWEADKIGVGRRNAVPASEAKDPKLRRGVTTAKIELQPRKIMVPFEISDDFRDINVEGDNVEEHVIQMMGKAVANDLEELCVNGDSLGPATLESDLFDEGDDTRYVKDTYLALMDGLLKKARAANVYDAAGANIGASVFSGMIRKMPTKFRRNRGMLRWLASPDLWQLWLERVSTRSTSAGDAALNGLAVSPFGIPPIEVPLMPHTPPVTQHLTLVNAADVKTLLFAPIESGSEVVTLSTLGNTPTTKLIKDTDYEINYATGAFNKKGGGAISDGATVKITYVANPQLILTHPQNIIIGIGARDIQIEKDRDIFRQMNQYAITVKVAIELEELTACVLGKNIGTGV